MTTLVLDTPELLARAAALAGTQEPHPHRLKFHYGFNRHLPDAEDVRFLRQHADWLRRHPAQRVRIHGHTDNFGSEDYNRFLSRLRARTVARLLLEEGVQEEQILLAHWGSERPLATADDHAANRRVELEYLDQEMACAL